MVNSQNSNLDPQKLNDEAKKLPAVDVDIKQIGRALVVGSVFALWVFVRSGFQFSFMVILAFGIGLAVGTWASSETVEGFLSRLSRR